MLLNVKNNRMLEHKVKKTMDKLTFI